MSEIENNTTSSGTEEDLQQVMKYKSIFEDAVNNNDLDLIKPHLAPEFSIVMYTDREFTDFEKFKTQWEISRNQLLKGGSYKMSLIPEDREFYGDTALSRGNSNNTLITGSGAKYEFSAHWSAFFKKNQNGEFKLVRAHVSTDPFKNPIVMGEVKKGVIKIGAAAFVTGLIICLILFWALGRI